MKDGFFVMKKEYKSPVNVKKENQLRKDMILGFGFWRVFVLNTIKIVPTVTRETGQEKEKEM